MFRLIKLKYFSITKKKKEKRKDKFLHGVYLKIIYIYIYFKFVIFADQIDKMLNPRKIDTSY